MPNPSALDVLAEELGIVAGRIEREAGLRVEAAISELRRIDAERELRLTNLERRIDERVATVKDGASGASVTVDDVAPLIDSAVQKAVAAIEAPKDGLPGKDADPEAIARAVIADLEERLVAAVAAIPPAAPGKDADPEMVKEMVALAVAGLPAPKDGEPGKSVMVDDLAPLVVDEVAKAVASIRIPEDGKDIDPADVERMVSEKVGAAVAALPAPEKGKDADPAEIARLVAAAVKEIPPASSGKDADPVVIKQMVNDAVSGLLPAKQGEPGKEGPPGKLPIVKEWFDRVHYEGEVVTCEGATFQAIRDTGRDTSHEDWICIARPGRDGADGRSFRIRGTYADGADYDDLDIVAMNGASFAAKRDNPGQCPGEGWQLVASQGKQGKPGERGGPGQKGDPGIAGPALVATDIDGDGMLTLTSGDGSTVTCDLYPLLAKVR